MTRKERALKRYIEENRKEIFGLAGNIWAELFSALFRGAKTEKDVRMLRRKLGKAIAIFPDYRLYIFGGESSRTKI